LIAGNLVGNNFVAVEAGRRFTLGLKDTGELVLWGTGLNNQMGTDFPSNLE
jgi:alpha-tubulin suppressor-like RCC1 family protein